MPESRGRRQRKRQPAQRQQKQTSPGIPSAPQKAAHRSLWEKFRDHPIWWAIGSLSAVVTLAAGARQALQGPDLALSDANVTLPFAVPIVVTNNSWPFFMTHAHVNCGVENIEWQGGGGIRGIGMIFPNPEQTLAPGKPAIFQCRIADVSGKQLLVADIYVSVSYRMLWFWPRTSDTIELTWFTGSVPPRWIVGHFPSPHL